MVSASEKAAAARARRLKQLFDLTPEEYDRILAFQGGHCAICPREPTEKMRLSVDHNHKTGEVRGLLCWLCNVALGKFRDDYVLLNAAAQYVNDPPVPRALKRAVIGRVGRVTNKVRKKPKKKG